ncbi:MAG: hypothetical protein DMF62_00360 [Acidobacteria bacterium]|nr:MAG: hypothetical protein DMF62_00360 [Acidobacteriota bacterium]
MNRLTLKWGSAKAWDLETEEARVAIQKWADHGVSMSAMMQQSSPEQKQCLIDALDFMDEIWLAWEGKKVSKEEAKQYLLDYGKHNEATR